VYALATGVLYLVMALRAGRRPDAAVAPAPP